MTDQTYLFIDGEYLRQRHREAMQEFFGVDGELELSPMMEQARASRAYFYDAIDYTRRTHESEKEWEARVLSQDQFFAYVRSLYGFHVRPGSVRSGKRREQKEVDVLLAVDMLTQGFKGSMGKAVLVAGDVDFRPVVEELVRHGVFVEVWYHRSSFAQELPGAADFGREIQFGQLHSWNTETFKRSHRIPHEEQPAGAPYGELVRVGSVAGYEAELRRHATSTGTHLSFWITAEPGRTICIRDDDENLIERYVAAQHAPIQWEPRTNGVQIAGEGGA